MGKMNLAGPGGGAVLIVCALLLASASVSAEELKLGYIDSARIFAEYKGTEDAQRSFDQEVATWEEEARVMRAELDSLLQEYQAQSLMLSDALKAEKEQRINEKRTTYETFVQSIWGPEGKLAEKNSALVQPIVDKINVVLQRIGEEEGFDLVLDAAAGGIVYAADELDLTDRILEELNQGFD
jgi:outer membrane protein